LRSTAVAGLPSVMCSTDNSVSLGCRSPGTLNAPTGPPGMIAL
jgi:hypothetical protein